MALVQSLDPKKLSKSEQIALDHYNKKPEGRGFFAVAELLTRHQQVDEAIQLLSKGLERHPSYTVARVFLAQLLFRRHFLEEAFATLESSPTSLKTNLTAQILRLKLAVLLANETLARSLVKELGAKDYHDSEARVIIEQLEFKPFGQVRRDYADFLKIPNAILPQDSLPKGDGSPTQFRQVESFLKAASQEAAMAEASFRERVAKGFFASPVAELFAKPSTVPHPDEMELDDLTRARLFRRQGLYQNAFDIYKKLIHASPGNELLRREFTEIRDLRDSQSEIDQQIDPELVATMEMVRKIDQNIALLNQLLLRLDEPKHDYADNSHAPA